MDAKSMLLTAMLTPYGIYIYSVLAMGLADATDIFEILYLPTCYKIYKVFLNICRWHLSVW